MVWVSVLIFVLAVYAVIGLVFALLFVSRGVQRVDPAAKGSPAGFRILILPGATALWPFLLSKWLRAKRGGVVDAA